MTTGKFVESRLRLNVVAVHAFCVVHTRVRLQRAHLEEDAGKIVYAGAGQISGSDYSLVDYNRAGVPLLEVRTEGTCKSIGDHIIVLQQ